ncbi:RagB/SusD family nutrient uptake outer membrane protein [Flavobacterium salmonis]|uniref:RagB/SusD family nutrient uptake outer membrane protein n=1 Tax=Flavobacterium salmonis TaxID=2654844 RepID=A0A6V6Z690_9FLAO|nr:RagB/SusD family nutrient uptake outer membrane protein [Flavobacterium salmonis]CAD0006954.1 RagB/SusD family nutrient uptake outer membrane protein [Flavobacterium salmonis]
MNDLKNIYRFKFTMLLAVLFLLQSCSDFLEQEPGTQISINEQLSTKAGILQALNGTYRELEANVRGERFAVYADVQGGNLKFTPYPTTRSSGKGEIVTPTNIQNVYSFNDNANQSNFVSFYSDSYDIINQSNLILEFTDALKDATESEKNQIKAEALTIRAYSHFLLIEIYSQNYSYTNDASHLGIIYNTESITKGLKYPARETAARTYTLIVEDITTALNLYSNIQLSSGPAYSYFNINSAKALLSRVYLAKNDWQNAYATANDVITNSGVSLMSSADYIAQWEKTDTPVSEILLEFSISRDATTGTVGGSMFAYFGYTSPTVFNNYVASQDLLNLYSASDIRKQLFLERPIQTLINNQLVSVNYYFTKKFQDNAAYVAFRLSEQYLIRAEAALKLNNPDQTKTDINVLRERANADLLADSEDLEEAIFLERRKELCFEGHLFFDIARNHKNISRNDGCIALSCGLTYPSPKFILPIPRNNINLNANLKQNESY